MRDFLQRGHNMKSIIKISILLTFISCGKQQEDTLIKPAEPEKYTYSFFGDGCQTGDHEYYYLDDACEALLNDEINNYCATEKREKLYNASCVY